MKFLVILHIYYEYMWQELKSYLLNLEEGSYDLVVTLSKENEELKKEILLLNPNSKIILCENRGYDVWPFIKALNEVNLDNYKYLIKLHTKRDLPDEAANNVLQQHCGAVAYGVGVVSGVLEIPGIYEAPQLFEDVYDHVFIGMPAGLDLIDDPAVLIISQQRFNQPADPAVYIVHNISSCVLLYYIIL